MSTEEKPEPTLKDLAKVWISRFESCVRSRKYGFLSKLFHEHVVVMGLESNICGNLDAAIDKEFKQVWPHQLVFTLDVAKTHIIPDAQSLMIIAPWSAKSVIVGSQPKQGRITILLGIFEAGKLLALHLHISTNPVPNLNL